MYKYCLEIGRISNEILDITIFVSNISIWHVMWLWDMYVQSKWFQDRSEKRENQMSKRKTI